MSITPNVPGPYQDLAVVLDQQRQEAARLEDLTGGVFRLCGFLEGLQGAGEWVLSVAFPVSFLEKPAFSFGGELEPTSPIHNGVLPTISGVVKDWRFKTRPDSGERHYTGATFLVVATGHPDQLMVFHYQLEGKALRAPLEQPGSNAGHPLLGSLWVNGVVQDAPAPYTYGVAVGPIYTGTANLDPTSVVFTIDGGAPFAVDMSAAPPTFNNTVIFLDPTFTTVGPPLIAGGAMIVFTDPGLPNGLHVVKVTCADVNGLTDTRSYLLRAQTTGGGPT